MSSFHELNVIENVVFDQRSERGNSEHVSAATLSARNRRPDVQPESRGQGYVV